MKKLYEIMADTDGIYGGRFSGAGFKGCCMALIILHESGAFVTQTALGFDGEATRKMSAFLQGPKPELLHHQKFFENGTAERAKESGTEQNYNMIDGCVNNVPQKPRRIGGRWSVLDRLHIKQAERRQKDNTPQQEQERSRKS